MDESIVCTICCEQFQEEGAHAPHLLSCGHTFCLSCLLKIGARGSSSSVSISCPTCREITRLSGDKACPPKNFQLIELLAHIRHGGGAPTSSPSAPDVSMMSASPAPSSYASTTSPQDPTPMCVEEPPPPPRPPKPSSSSVARTITFIEFSIPEANVFDLVRDWLGSLWFAPEGIKAKSVVSHEARACLVPHWVFVASLKATVTGTEETRTEETVKRKPWSHTASVDHRAICLCAAEDADVRSLVENSFAGSWDTGRLVMHDPSLAREALAQSGAPAAAAAAAASSAPKSRFSAWFANLWTPSSSPKEPKFVELPPCEVLQNIPADEVWQIAHKRIVDELSEECRDAVRRRKEHQNVGYSLSGIRVTFGAESYEYRLVYMPVYLGHYEFDGTQFHFAVSGQTGAVYGDRPWAGIAGTIRKAWTWLTGSK